MSILKVRTYMRAVDVLFKERLRELMKENALNQVKLAQNAGLKQNTISAWLAGKKEPSLTSLWRVADYFDVSIDYLVGRSDD